MQCVFVLVSDHGMQMLACTEAEGSLWLKKKKKQIPWWQERSKKLRKDSGELQRGFQVVPLLVAMPATEVWAASGLVLLV